MGRFLESLNKKLRITEPDSIREQFQSYMSAPEWRNVEMSQELALFIQEGNSMFRFPYFRQIFDLWGVVYKSYSAARVYDSRMAILTSEYMLMDIFIGIFTTLEFTPKGILSLLLSPFLNAKNNTEMQHQLAQYFTQYAKDLQTIPFYDQKYKEIRTGLAEAYSNASAKTWGDWFSWKFLSAELFARHWISKPLSAWYHSENNIVPATTDVLVKFKAKDTANPEIAQREFMKKIEALKIRVSVVRKSAHAKQHPETIENLHIYPKEYQEGKTYTSIYALLRAHRYAAFQEDLKALSQHEIKVKKIAGQEHVQVKCELKEVSSSSLQSRQDELKKVPHARFLYSYGDRIHERRRLCLFDIPVKELANTLDTFKAYENVDVPFIHNF